MVDSLLRKVPTAGPNLPGNEDGLTALHVVCEKEYDDVSAKMLFEICKDLRLQTIRLEVRVQWQGTPLHVTLARGRSNLVQLLLRNGANPNLADADGSLALHTILREKSSQYDDDYAYKDENKSAAMLLEVFFETDDAANHRRQPVQIDALDESGRTPFNLLCASATSERWNCC
ncbi:unnamed protein product [Trichogramma brassicae]|uniref:Uncharacterized protein n=1 Tax=Trichogramma brassicae TaxID=86971 RepID=A0A6H5HY39_9HYME|nr:unnamed protein product [Trichogramma brassicae]